MSGRLPVTVLVQGGIASGKSTITRLLCERGATHVDCDRIAHEILETDELKQLLQDELGADCVVDGQVDRAAIANHVFSDEAALKRLEGWVHPRVRDRVQQALEAARVQEGEREVLVVDAAVAEKMELTETYDLRVFVDVDIETRRARAATRGWAEGELERREARQVPLPERRDRADFVIPNQGSLEEAKAHVERFWTEEVQPRR